MKQEDVPTSKNSPSSGVKDLDLSAVISHVFGNNSLETIFQSNHVEDEPVEKEILKNINLWISNELDTMQPSLSTYNEDIRPGRLGTAQVRFDTTVQTGSVAMSPDHHSYVQARSNFSTVRANVCCFSGQWQYEIQLESKGVVQLGWSLNGAQFSAECGVGDTIDSFAYDGNRVRKWNLETNKYGETWQAGDIIGCTLDLDIGSIHFYRNGKDLGEAFSAIPSGPGCAYFAALSLALEEKVRVNFGSTPFKYPIKPFEPLQQPPRGAVIRTNQLLHWLSRLSHVPRHSPKFQTPDEIKPSPDAIKLLLCEMLIRHLTEYVSETFIIDGCIVPFLHDSLHEADQNGLPRSRSSEKVNYFLDTISLLLEPDDFNRFIIAICKCLVVKFNQTSESLDYNIQKYTLGVISQMCQNTTVRKTLLKQPDFIKTRLAFLMELNPIDTYSLKQCMPQPWWDSEELKSEAIKLNYFQHCQTVNNKTSEVEQMQDNILLQLLNHNDSIEGSSRECFLPKIRQFIKDNHITGMVNAILFNQNVEVTPLPMVYCMFNRLVSVLRVLWREECPSEPVCVPTSMFYKGDVDYFAIDRLGGVLSHLIHSQRTALQQELGEDHRIFTPGQLTVPIQTRIVNTAGIIQAATRVFNIPIQNSGSEPVAQRLLSSADTLVELLDGVIMLYHSTVHKQLLKISKLRDDMDKYIKEYNAVKKGYRSAEDPEVMAHIEMSIQVLKGRIDEQSQIFMAWVRGFVFTHNKRSDLVWLLEATLLTLEVASERGDMFGFVPEYYLNTTFEICSALINYFSPTLPLDSLQNYESLMMRVAELLTSHFCDPRIVNPNSKDKLTEVVANFISKKNTLEYLETVSTASQEHFVSALLTPYETIQAWAQNNWILMRVWQGNGFAFRYKISPHKRHKFGISTPDQGLDIHMHDAFEPCPSTHYQYLISKHLSEDQKLAADFINSVLKVLNWTFSELLGMLQEIQNIAKRPQTVIIDSRQLKMCATLFDILVGLLRVLEMICSLCLQVFTDNLLERLSQLLGQILLRVSAPNGTFCQVVSMNIPNLNNLDQFPVLAALTGVLIAVFSEEISEEKKGFGVPRKARCFLSDPSFEIKNLKCLLGEFAEVKNLKKERYFNLENYTEDVSETELQTVRQLISLLSHYKDNMSVSERVDEDDLCPICYAMPLTTTFMPCQHQSCKSCITHHLMDNKKCFFCNRPISSVVSQDGEILFDFNQQKDNEKV